MRQAGRYQRAYQTFRRRHSFEKLCRDPELSAKVALASIEDFDFDAAILFSDLLFPLDAIGLGLTYSDDGPQLARRFSKSTDDPAVRSTRSRPISRSRPKPSRQRGANFRPTRVSSGSSADPGRSSCTPSKGRIAARSRERSRRWRCTGGSLGRWCPSWSASPRGNSRPAPTSSWSSTQRPASCRRMRSGGTSSPTSRNRGVGAGPVGYFARGVHPAHFENGQSLPGAWAGHGFDWRWSLADVLSRPGRQGFVQGNFDPALLHLEGRQLAIRIDEFLTPLASLEPEVRRGLDLRSRPRRAAREPRSPACARS